DRPCCPGNETARGSAHPPGIRRNLPRAASYAGIAGRLRQYSVELRGSPILGLSSPTQCFFLFQSAQNPRTLGVHRFLPQAPRMKHDDIWRALDTLAAENGLSASGLARRAGLDPTTFNPSKRRMQDGRARWPSTESVAKVLEATGASLEAFTALVS